MQSVEIGRLEQLNRGLDIFEATVPDKDLLLKGLYPPLPISGSYLVWGFSLLNTARQLGISFLNGLEIPALDKVPMLIVALKMENRVSRYTWEEKEKIVNFLAEAGEFPAELGLLLEGKTDPDLRNKYEKYIALPLPLKSLVKQDLINFKTALEIYDLPPDIFQLFLGCQENWKFSYSERRLFLTWFYEIYKRDRMNRETAVAFFRQLTELPNPLQEIRLLRYPCLTGLEEKLSHFRDKWLKGSGIELKAPENFEGAAFSLNFSFTVKNFRRKLEVLQKIEEHKDELAGLL